MCHILCRFLGRHGAYPLRRRCLSTWDLPNHEHQPSRKERSYGNPKIQSQETRQGLLSPFLRKWSTEPRQSPHRLAPRGQRATKTVRFGSRTSRGKRTSNQDAVGTGRCRVHRALRVSRTRHGYTADMSYLRGAFGLTFVFIAPQQTHLPLGR